MAGALRSWMLMWCSCAILFAAPPALQARLDFDAEIPSQTNLQIVVLEAPGCIYCGLFRRDVFPAYLASQRAKSVPLRFVDINDATASDFDLATEVSVVPTVVLLDDNKEVGRIPGYVGPENFFQAINHLIATLP